MSAPVEEKKSAEEKKSVVETKLPEKKTYVILMETNFDYGQSWYSFLRTEGNEKALESLKKDLESLPWDDNEDTEFFLDLKHPVSEQCADDMIRVDLNSYSFHRKFDGELDVVDFGFKKKDDDEKKMKRVIKMIGMGDIGDFAHGEDEPDPSDSQGESSSSEESSSSSEDSPPEKKKKRGKMPYAVMKRLEEEKKRK